MQMFDFTGRLGGVIARIGDQIYDSSIRTRLASLKNALLPN